MRGQQELQWTDTNGELLCHPTSKDLEHKEEEEQYAKLQRLFQVYKPGMMLLLESFQLRL